ncbi:MAG: sugar phosphate isomerase/epimerase family protein [Armatimonadota bacterium]
MIIGCAVWTINAPTLAERVEWIAEQGFEAISLITTKLARDEADLGFCQNLVRDHELTTTFHLGIGKIENGPHWGQWEEQMREVEGWLGAVGRVAHVSFDAGMREVGPQRYECAYQATAEVLRETIGRLADHGVQVLIENGWGPRGTEEPLHRLKEAVGDDRLGMLLDLGHTNIRTHLHGLQPADYVASLPLAIHELHVHDNDGVSDQHEGVGAGCIDLSAMCRGLKVKGFDGIATVEVCPGVKPIDQGDPEQMCKISHTKEAFDQAWREA